MFFKVVVLYSGSVKSIFGFGYFLGFFKLLILGMWVDSFSFILKLGRLGDGYYFRVFGF